jgi:two-component system response regulator RegX3
LRGDLFTEKMPGMGEPVTTLLTVRGEPSSLDTVTAGLRREGFVVIEVMNGQEALQRFDALRPDAVLLDTTLPGMSGIDLCRALRMRSPVPILVLDLWEDEVDLVVTLEVGADAYLTPPFRLREVVARLRALVSRARSASQTVRHERVLIGGGIRLDPDRREAHVRGRQVQLTPHEFEILEMLMGYAGRLVTREALVDRVWNGAVAGDVRTVDVQVNSLRVKVETDPRQPQLIKTVRGLGYRFENRELPGGTVVGRHG